MSSTNITPEVLAVVCRACFSEAGVPCIVGATGKKASKSHNIRVMDAEAREVASLLDTPDTETADEFSEYAEAEAEDEAEAINAEWVEIGAHFVAPGLVLQDKKGGVKGTVAARRVGAKWITALDADMNTLLYVANDGKATVFVTRESWIGLLF